MPAVDLTALYRDGLAHQQAGRVAEALVVYDRILALKSDIPEVLFQKARCLSDQPAVAEALFRKALQLKPKEPAIWQGLHSVLFGKARTKLEAQAHKAGIVVGSEKDMAKAQKLWRNGDDTAAEVEAVRLTKAAPQAFWPVYTLGLIREGAAAVPALEAAHARDPSHMGARMALARAALAAGQIARVEMLLSTEGLPPEATLIRAQMLRETAQPDGAADLLAEAPAKDRAWQVELALSSAAASRGNEAAQALERAIAAGAPRIATTRRVAMLAEAAGDIATAESMIDEAANHAPNALILTHRAQLRQSAGDIAGAEADLDAALQHDATHGEAFRALSNGRKVMPNAPLVGRLEQALAAPHVAAGDRAGLLFAAAKCAADLGQHDKVMDHLHRANRLMAKAFPYGLDADIAAAKALVTDWTALDPVAQDGPTAPVIFVTGLPRSGTTLVETILASHPQVGAGGEMAFLGQALTPTMDLLRREGRAEPEMLRNAGERYLTLAARCSGQPPVIVDKAISTFSRMGHAVRALPGARIVHVTRDPRDVGFSLYRNRFPNGLHRYAYDLTAMGRYIRLHDAISEYWHNALPDRVHRISYEALTAEPEVQIRALLQAVDLPWDPACLAPQNSDRRIQTLSFAQAREPIGRAAVAGWERHADALGPLIKALEEPVTLD
ncbi:tetratricopeptide repeat-containing sulfotransferase family protein [Gymnodinialimonas hymeniacidonis]|uniref:tetratricopeptide repeat-containing sulfotransferase family protein n=1 Tax=Gymnodinialimonas hymeniacidonis TaxID=3126508 RepID=UPI0034C60539